MGHPKKYEDIVYYVKLILGTLIVLSNFLVFGLLVTKDKKRATDILILANLFVDAIYGLQMICWPAKFLYSPDNPDLSLLAIYMEDSLIFLSLSMVVVMAYNRYVAVVTPFRLQDFTKTQTGEAL